MKPRINRPPPSSDSTQKLVLVMLAAGLLCAAEIFMFFWAANRFGMGGGVEIDRLQNKVSAQAQQTVEPQEGYINTESEAEVRGDDMQTEIVSGRDMLPPIAVGKAKDRTVTDANTNNSGTATSSDLNPESLQPTVDVKILPQETNRDSGTWAINLVSFQRKVDAERFVIKANSKGIATVIIQVTVSGKKYWRVQIPGFSSPDEAGTKASEVENKLGLKDVWIVQR
jgi:cell division septation protein DedD